MAPSESVTLTFPRATVQNVVTLSSSLAERMHALLDRNSEGQLNPVEREELETLVQMAQFGQILSLALNVQGHP